MKLLHWLIAPPPAGLGIELRRNQVVLARFGDRRGRAELDLCLKAPVPSGVIEFSMLESNIREPEALSSFIRQLLEQAGVRNRRIALTVPDTLARISVEDLPEAAGARGDAGDLLRFRLKKTLPFGAEQARIAYQALPGKGHSYFTGVMYDEVVSQYETLLEGLGFHVGHVETSTLSLLNLWRPVVDSEIPLGADYFLLFYERWVAARAVLRAHPPVSIKPKNWCASSYPL
jgi:type IV pilus assembly protein PilM